jgi:lysophospholipase L1-like esterase
MIPKRIVVIGGSTVHGQGDPEGGGFVARLRRWHETSSVESHRVFNLGIGGDGVREMLARGPEECRARRPDLIILYPGLNDTRRIGGRGAPQQNSFETIRETLNRLVAQLRSIAQLAVLSAVPIDESRTSPFCDKWYFRMDDAVRMAALVADVCRSTETPHLPLFEAWSNRTDLEELLADGLHLNSFGHELLFREVSALLETLFPRD